MHGTRADNLIAYVDPAGATYRGDFDDDGDVDQEDFGALQTCFTLNLSQATGICAAADWNSDDKIDGDDLTLFMACFNGPNAAPLEGCPIW